MIGIIHAFHVVIIMLICSRHIVHVENETT